MENKVDITYWKWDVFGNNEILIRTTARPPWIKRKIISFLFGSTWVESPSIEYIYHHQYD